MNTTNTPDTTPRPHDASRKTAGRTALDLAEENGHDEAAGPLRDAGAVNGEGSEEEEETRTLIEAADDGDLERVEELLADGADVNEQNDAGDTALCAAAWSGNAEVVQALLAAGADVNVTNDAGDTALFAAARSGKAEAVQALLAAGADVNVTNDAGDTALLEAARCDHAEMVRALLAAGADATVINRDGGTVSSYAEAWAVPAPSPLAPPSGDAETFTNSIGMEFVRIPAGAFQMGSADDDEDAHDDEKPRHEVTISRAFHLGKYPVTQARWRAVMGENPSTFKGPDHPVENVSWEDAQEFIAKLNAAEGHERYRLPTEAEWEYACRAGSGTKYSFGDDAGELGHHAWYGGNSGDEIHPVGQKRPNAWGLHDMHGNVREWVRDWYGEYSAGAAVDPQGPDAGASRVLRGGSGGWFHLAWACRSACRNLDEPGSRRDLNGFRLALSPGR